MARNGAFFRDGEADRIVEERTDAHEARMIAACLQRERERAAKHAERASREERLSRLRYLVNLDQVAAGVGEDREFHLAREGRFHRELHAGFLESCRLGFNIVYLERRDRDALLEERLLIRFGSGIGVGLEHEFDIIATFGRDECEPTKLAHRDVLALLESEHAGVEIERPV